MSTTHDALIGSLLRCALAVIGSHLPSDLYSKMDTVATNVAARKILGVDRTAKTGTLNLVAGPRGFSNMVVIYMADYLDLVLRAHGSAIRSRVVLAVQEKYKISRLEPERVKVKIPIKEILADASNERTVRVWETTSWEEEQTGETTSWETTSWEGLG